MAADASTWDTDSCAIVGGRRHGLNRTAGALHLDAHKLKSMADARRSVVPPTFVEVAAAPLVAGGCECTVELDGPRGGRLRVTLRGAMPPDVVALSRVVWGGT